MTNAKLLTAEARALERAITESVSASPRGVHVHPINPLTWVATTTAGRSYLLKVSRHNVRCDCPAGCYGRVCKHAALVRHARSIMLPPRPGGAVNTGRAARRAALTPSAH